MACLMYDLLLLLVSILELGAYADTIHLSPKRLNVEENSSVSLTCSKENGKLQETRWTNSQIQGYANLYFLHGKCTTTKFLLNNELFGEICNGDGTFSVLLKRVDRTQHGAIWQCKEALISSNQVTINVSVPVTSVNIYTSIETYMKENHSQTIRCKPSTCRPKPTVTWFLRNPADTKYNVTELSTQTNAGHENGLIASESVLNFFPNRSVNGWVVMCEAWNYNDSPAVLSKKIVLNVSYPPDSPPKIYGYGSGDLYRIIEADNREFSCSITGGNPLANLSWNCFNSESTTVKVVNNSVISNITWDAVRNQNVCSCDSNHIYNGKQAAYVNVTVLYPPTMPFFTINSSHVFGVVNIIQNNTLQISCKSISNPMPSYTWNGPYNFNRLGQILGVTVTQMHEEGRYKCTAKNRMVRSDNSFKDGSNTSYINVKMLYPPKELHCRYGNKDGKLISKNSFYVIKGDSFSIYCDAEGYPRPVFKWDNYTDGHSLNITAIRSDARKTCVATNWMNETEGESRTGSISASFSISVLYPPSKPTIRVSNGNTNEITDTARISIIETDTIELSCYSMSKPMPRYTWFMNKSKLTEHRNVTLATISRADAGNYTCLANNIMNSTFGKYEARTNTSSTLLNVLYPPDVGPLINVSLTEESTLNITCPFIHGNPLNTTVFWSRKKDDRRWNNKQLIILNVSRTDDTVYTCTVINKMIPTFGSVIEKKRSGEFHLNIFFSAEISNFSVIGNGYKESTVVNETEEVPLSCTAEANPASNITITGPKQEVVTMVSNKNSVHHTLRNVSYVNAGQYICTGRNNFTDDKTSSSKLILIVKCPPRPSFVSYNDGKVATTLLANATLTFTAHDFLDEPNKTVFRWFKDNAPVESNVSKLSISSSGLQSNLSVSNLTEKDFGQYSVRVTNSIGNYIHKYVLQAKDKPEMPKDFFFIKDSITDTSVKVKWVPGFHGGYPQNFILLYKRITEHDWQNKSIEDTGDRHMNYTLFGLLSKSDYQVKMFARNEEGDSPYTNELQLATKAPIAQPIDSKSPGMVGIVAGSVSGVIIVSVAGIIFGVFIYRRRNIKEKETAGKVYQNLPLSGKHFNAAATSKRNHKTTKTRKTETVQIEETTFEGGLQEVDDVPILINERTEYCNSPEIIETIKRILVSELFSYVSEKSEDLFEAEYQKLPTELQRSCAFARKPENIALNRYNGIYPYDHSRVKLQELPDFFINACYIDGYKNSKSYIASLGPTSKTTNHFETFWQMIWFQRSDIIVMLTNLREPSGMKCEQYWPKEGQAEQYGDVCVSSQTAEAFAEYTVRTFSVSSEEERRYLTHLHYTAWPDKTVPEDVTSLIEFRQRMKSTPTSSEGPIVIHCSAGIGRTGTLIALDRLIEEGHDKGSVDVFDCVNNMREQRVKMVQTHEQYIYIHKALVNALTFDCEALPVETFNEYVETTNNNTYSRLFQQLRQTVETDSKAEANDRSKNGNRTEKNRRGADIPGCRFRVLLYLDRRGEGSEYINAVYINSFKKKDCFITAQSPLPNTVTDFIAMIYQENCSCIATMEHLKEPGMKVGQYLPDDNHTLALGNFKVSCSVLETKPHFVVRKMKIKYAGQFESGEKGVYHFQFTKWMPGHDTPANAEEFVQFVNEVEEYADELGEERSPVLVHCLKANERSGLFSAVAILMEKIKIERQVSVSNTLRHLRTRRQTAIISMEQFKFCYQATSAYIKNTLK